MKLLFASDSFKGSLSSKQITTLLEGAAKKVFPGCQTIGIPIADGGEGTVGAMVSAVSGFKKVVTVANPLMQDICAEYGVLYNDTAIIETAAASGITLIPNESRNPLYTTSYGTGQLIKAALDEGYRKIIIALGGSATNDGGMGALSALGVRFYDSMGNTLEGRGSSLAKVYRFSTDYLHPAIKESSFTVMCDVDNPLLGKDGATYTFGPQKGGTLDILNTLERGMENYANVLQRELGIEIAAIKGGGAAGGLGAAFTAFLNANMKSGIDTMLDTVSFDTLIDDVDLVVTGEGRMDWQSAFGKATSGIASRCKEYGVPVLAIVGSIGEGADRLYDMGIDSIIPIIDSVMTIEYAMENAKTLYEGAALRAFRMIRIGKELKYNKLKNR